MILEQLDIRGLSRRRLLGAVLMCAGAAATACGGRARSSGDPPAVANGRRFLVLSADDLVTLAAFAEAVLPAPGLGPSYVETDILRRLDEEMFFVEAAVRADLDAALSLLEWYPLVSGHVHRFSHLKATGRTALIERMLSSRFDIPRAIANSLRFMVHFLHYAHPATWAMTDFDGPFSRLAPQLSEQRLRYLELTKAVS